jgi:hypothetical protein
MRQLPAGNISIVATTVRVGAKNETIESQKEAAQAHPTDTAVVVTFFFLLWVVGERRGQNAG